MEKQAESKFTFTWIIENFSMCHQSYKEYIYSEFTSDYLPRIKWKIKIYPRGRSYENDISLFLRRTDDIPDTYNVTFTMQILDCREKSILGPLQFSKIFEAHSAWCYPSCIERDSLFELLINDVLIVKFSLKPVSEASDEQILPPLPYKNGLFADVVLGASSEEFKVHKAVLWARWQRLVEKMDAEQTREQIFDIGSDVLEAILKYVYTGKLDSIKPDLLTKLDAAAKTYELSNLKCLPVVAQTARTIVSVKKISFEWPINNFSSLLSNAVLRNCAFTVNFFKSCVWNFTLHMREDAVHGRKFDISLSKTYKPKAKGIFVKSKISFDDSNSSEDEHLFETNENWIVPSTRIFVKSKVSFDDNNTSEDEHMFETDENWICAKFSRTVSVDPEDTLLLKFELMFSDCQYFSEIMDVSYACASSVNCYSFNNDFRKLYENRTLSDVNIIVGSKTFPAHKCVLCARSSVFAKMFETDMIESETNKVEISDIEPQVMDEFLQFTYTGNLKNSLNETAEQLYAVADKYDVPALKKKCSSFLKSNLSVENVFRTLQIANMHSDDDLYKSVFEFTSAHGEEIFMTHEWKDIAKNNFHVKLLYDTIVQKKLSV
ncbi:speckle-type POZ protein B-like [Stegodyphus dumicola]|uniref:speckle-type POZ protein B-like n=1 Tax=Stegodyphus dumicola TaxID=202533 RepID=UPI0015A79984|nr:speckle-type POZ protein B-like [Stegodyphus dumicola]